MKKVELKTEEREHRANWLELFYDLVYVIVIARLTHMIVEAHGGHGGGHVGLRDYVTYVCLFVPVWWAWTGHTMLENRFGSNDLLDRLLTLVQMFGLILLAVFVTQGLDKQAQEFALSYAFVRFMLVAMYARVHLSNSTLRPVTRRFITGFSLGAGLWALSVLFTPPAMFALWVLGLVVDMLTPVVSRHCLAKVSVHRSHLPERTGLLFIIILGESLLVLVNAIENVTLSGELLFHLLLAFSLVVTVWWYYFEAMEQTVMGKLSGAAQLHIYGHLPIYIGLGLLAAFSHKLLDGHSDPTTAGLLLAVSFALILVPTRAIQFLHVAPKTKPVFIWMSLVATAFIFAVYGLSGSFSATTLTMYVIFFLISFMFFEKLFTNNGG